MKNEIGRKLTSLTIMAIMFAGLGLVQGVPSFMPAASADFSLTDGELSVSSEFIQGAAVLEIVVNDPDLSDTTVDINSGASVSIGGTSYDMSQAQNGKWYLYVVDQSISKAMKADGKGMEFGHHCDSGLGVSQNTSNLIVPSGTDVWAAAINTAGDTDVDNGTSAGGCLDIDNAPNTTDDTAGSTARQDLTAAILQDAPTLSDHDDNATDLGQQGHKLNASGYGSWPYILSIELNSDNIIEYGSDSVNVEFGNTDEEANLAIINPNPGASAELHVTVTDPALNIDPTTADIWIFDLDAASSAASVIFANNGTNTAITAAELGEMQCEDNCRLYSNIVTVLSGYDDVTMTESSENSGFFESFDLNGESQIETTAEAGADTKVVFTYGDESTDMIITYTDATIEFGGHDGAWDPTEVATFTIVDPDANKNPSEEDELEIGDETDKIPTIKMGSPKTLAGGSNACLDASTSEQNTNLCDGGSTLTYGISVGGSVADGGIAQGVFVANTTDNSERLRVVHNGTESDSMAGETATWINVTTGHTRADLVKLPGTVVLSYDVTGPAELVDSNSVSVYVVDSGSNSSEGATTGQLDLLTTGNARSGVLDLDDGTHWLKSRDVSVTQTWTGTGNAGTNLVTVAFKLGHAAGKDLATSADYAIAADFCNFDQNNGSLVHNCIYRIEAEETGDNTGIFQGTVEYINLNNSTDNGSISGEHDGNDQEVDSLLTDMGQDGHALVVLMDSVDGTDAVRVIYNDTDALQESTEIGAQLDSNTYTGTVDLDADTYEADDLATITIVDADLNQDSSIRDTYQNSSTTFQITVTGSDGVAEQHVAAAQTIIETTSDSGVFVGTFKVPDYNGEDIEITYYESRDASGYEMEFYDTATVVSNDGTVSFDRAVYPVPFASGEIEAGDNTTDIAVAGKAVITVTVEDADFTNDTLTTGSTTAAGTIKIKLIEGSTTSTCFTAGSIAAYDSTSGSVIEELGPLSEVERDSSIYEIEFSMSKVEECGASDKTVSSGDVLQVQYVDTSDSSGSTSTVYDSSTFDLRTGSLSVDKDVYVLGSDMVVTLTDPDLNLDAGTIETYTMNLIEWDSDADSSELMADTDNFTSNPSNIQETGDDTGVFQSVVTLPTTGLYAGGDSSTTIQTIDFGEAVTLTYADQGLAGEDQVGDDDLDVEAYFSISNFGALIELDKAVYNWTDVVYFSITAPDHNRNTASEEQIGSSSLPIQVTTRIGKMCTTGDKTYKADESSPDSGVFEGEIQLSGFDHTMSSSQAYTAAAINCGSANDSGVMKTDSQTDGISVSYEYNDAQVVVASASIVWNIGEAYFDSSAVSAGGSALVTVVDPDENTDDDVIDTFTIDIFSDSDNGGFNLTMNETNEDTGVFEGTVFFTTDLASSGTSLRVSEGDTVTAEYTDETLPEPYTTDDDLTIAATTTVGTAFPPLERAPAANARVVDAFGASVAEVSVDQQVQIAADVSNGQSKDQAFAYLVQVQDGDGVTVSLAWITGSLTAGQSMSPALSWTPSGSGSYTATVFVWESVDNPTALSPTVSVDIDVV